MLIVHVAVGVDSAIDDQANRSRRMLNMDPLASLWRLACFGYKLVLSKFVSCANHILLWCFGHRSKDYGKGPSEPKKRASNLKEEQQRWRVTRRTRTPNSSEGLRLLTPTFVKQGRNGQPPSMCRITEAFIVPDVLIPLLAIR